MSERGHIEEWRRLVGTVEFSGPQDAYAALAALEAELARAREENALLRRSLKVLADDLALTDEDVAPLLGEEPTDE